jgi:hypothetical protein
MKGKRNGKKAVEAGKAASSTQEADTGTLWRLLSRICWHVSSVLEADAKTPRVTGTVSIFYQDGGVKVCIRDRQAGKVAFVWAPSFEEALLKAQAALEVGSLDWRPDRYATSG